MEQLNSILHSKISTVLELVSEDVKKEVDKYLQQYYDEYDPSFGKSMYDLFYHRTNQLRRCCKIKNFKSVGNITSVEIYLDLDSLNYVSQGADAYKSIVSANAGLHGGYDIANISNGQVSWSKISGNTGASYGSGTQIWKEPVTELINKGKLIEIFKRCAKQRGLKIE